MIRGDIKDIQQHAGLGGRLTRALNYLKSTDFTQMSPGRYDIDGSDIYARIMTYETKPYPEGKWEAHKAYIDIQYIARGTEFIGYGDISAFTVKQAYDEKKDCEFLEGQGEMLLLKEGSFAIFWPQDVHMPMIACGQQEEVIKVVVKVKV